MTDITLLDGSIGQELVKRGGDAPTPFWSTSVMVERPQLVRDVHASYFAAGASVATTNTYAILRDRFEGKADDLADRLEELTTAAIMAAAQARDANGSGRLAGAIGPLGASYRTDLTTSVAEAVAGFAEPIANLKGRVDLLLFETMSSLTQAQAALSASRDAGMPVWLSVSVDDDNGTLLRSGEPLADLAPIVSANNPAAVLINCSRPEAVGTGLDILATFGKPFGAYANGFTKISEGFLKDMPTVDALEARHDLNPQAYADFAMSWVEQGATIIGGCCEVGPDHIAELASRLRSKGHQII